MVFHRASRGTGRPDVPTLAAPVLDTGGTTVRHGRDGVSIWVVAFAFVGAVVVTVVGLRLALGPLNAEQTAASVRLTSDRPVLRTASTSEPAGKPSARVERPAGVQRDPALLVQQFIREFLTVKPGESRSEVAGRMEELLSPDFMAQVLAEPFISGGPGSLVEVGTVTEVERGVYEMPLWPWVYSLGEEAQRGDRQVWRVEVGKVFGQWLVTRARQV